MFKVAVVGAGAFGTALANYSRKLGYDVAVWCFEKELPDIVVRTGENALYLPGIPIDPKIVFTNDPAQAVSDADLIILVCPSAYMRSTSALIADIIPEKALIVSAAKGIEADSLKLMSEILEETLHRHEKRLTYISGPSFARDVAAGLPTDLACAARDIEQARAVQKLLHSASLRIYSQDDVVGTELAGALKNVIAVACGAADALELGASARASLMTRGLAEMTRLGTVLGARPMTFLGLAGVGDLILTCTGDLSRNRTLGKRLALGESAAEIIASQKAVAEGYVTARPAVMLARSKCVEMPICEAVYRVCYEGADLKTAAAALLSRKERDEMDEVVCG
jgi:glycerol-3-phosphate dehydrogenase (NAD(P)+)